ncbi:MAG: UPF0175 family protein [Verrucomicrobiaceae bacterium]|nr:UPF0175 family protein [Verrucomicrobiaceae bacterium]
MNASLNIEVPQDLLYTARMTLNELRLELAIILFQRERCSLGKAASFAVLPVGEFLTHLSARKIGIHADSVEALEDAARIDAFFPVPA